MSRFPTFQCECGDYHCRITALQPIGTNEVLSSYLESDKTTLLVQFDGSCHADRETGGAGAALRKTPTRRINVAQMESCCIA